MKKNTENNLTEIIRKAGFRATDARLSVISFLMKAKYPLSIQEIIDGLGRSDFDQVTVYRTVNSFRDKGLVREVNLRGDDPRYELSDSKNDHHHIVCTKCHRIEDFIGCVAEKIEKKVLYESSTFSKITGHSFDFYGLCNKCAK